MTDSTTQHAPCVDHLVVLAADLASGVAWCQRTLGITPTAGGEHPLMGTHNRIFNVSSPASARLPGDHCYQPRSTQGNIH